MKPNASYYIYIILCAIIMHQTMAWRNCKDDKEEEKTVFQHILESRGWAEFINTLETSFRAFSMGFGLTIINDFLVKGRRTKEQQSETWEFAKIVGFGFVASIFGLSLFVPRSWRESSF